MMAFNSVYILLVIFGSTIAYDSGAYIIKTNPHLVLDGRANAVTIQSYDPGNKYQLWYLALANHGRYIILNKGTGKALDVARSERRSSVVTHRANHYSPSQKWYLNDDGTIVNAESNFALDVSRRRFGVGSTLVVYPKRMNNTRVFGITAEGPRELSYEQRWS